MEEAGLHFPLHMNADGDDYVIDREDEFGSPTSPNYYTSPEDAADKTRLKRRRRCGQCGPCQVKENCNKCHYCIRKDVLKQTCIYRKCVYLRSKPRPYSRTSPRQQHSQTLRPSVPPPSSNLPPQVVKSPILTEDHDSNTKSSSEVSSPVLKNETVSCLNPFLPSHIQENQAFSLSVRPSSHPDQLSSQILKSSASVHQPFLTEHHSAALSTLQQSVSLATQAASDSGHSHISFSPSTVHNSQNPPVNHGFPYVSSQTMLHHPPKIRMPPPGGMFSDARNQPPLGMPQHVLQNQHSMPFAHFSHRFGGELYSGYNKPPSVSDTRAPVQPDQCMHPPFHSPLSNVMERTHFQSNIERTGSGPSFFPSNPEMFRPYASLSAAYPYPPSPGGGYYPHSVSGPHLPMGMGIQPPPGFSHISHQGNFPQAYSNFSTSPHPSFEQSGGCPKNGCCPPVSLNVDTDSRVMQERYGSIHKSNPLRDKYDGNPKSDILHKFNPATWASEYFCRLNKRPNSAVSDDVSRASMTSSDFECDVISIDDFRMNAFIRSDGCNSIEIEIEDRVSESGQLSNCSSNSVGSIKSLENLNLKTFEKNEKSRNLKSSEKSEKNSDSGCEIKNSSSENVKMTVKGVVFLKQDLGDEGIIHLEIPGEKVTIEDSWLDDNLAKYSCDLEDLLDFIRKEPKIEYLENDQRLC
ncbi:hypothetical protein KUTeg_023634 [Tegillarca granosa]|uniref:CXXC-type domain-containing protein n=1 Tax=Tegillarca granosa TaxID=220873 RepID=A0ABQ9E2M1_TEGGR|nr:hypothetical protein KUTeg_023634 [Tegillarca granosa]